MLEDLTVSWGSHPTRWWNRGTGKADSTPSDEAVFNTGVVGSVVVESDGDSAQVYYWK